MTPRHDVLAPGGVQAAHIADLWWLAFWVCTAVFVAIMVALAWALWRAPRSAADTQPDEPALPTEKRATRVVSAAVAVSSVLLVGLLVASFLTDRALAMLPRTDAVTLRVTAHQWWWEVTYEDALPDRVFSTANEIHIPVGRPIVATLSSDDVIHSFWVPSLHGKKDLIPAGRDDHAARDEPGEYRGFCAEFCGLQHAFMALRVVAEPAAKFDAWAEAQRQPAPEPADAAARRGRDLFLSGSCMLCHAVQGTPAQARKAPDLTHVASRSRLAAGRLLNTPEDLERWIRDPQLIKPGVRMPAHPLSDEDMRRWSRTWRTLK
jgi:cytochrome c oxidase subunit 2